MQAAALTEKEVAEDDSELSDTETTFTEGHSQAASQNGPSKKPANTSKAKSKKSKKQPGPSTASEADEARELAEMRKGGFITGEGKKGAEAAPQAALVHTLPIGCAEAKHCKHHSVLQHDLERVLTAHPHANIPFRPATSER